MHVNMYNAIHPASTARFDSVIDAVSNQSLRLLMIIFPNRLCLHFADSLDLAKLLRRRACKIGDRFKMRQQRTAACCADAGDILQRRVHARLLAQIAVMGDAEAVGLHRGCAE